MNIFLISRGIPTSDNPTWGNFELDQAKELQKLGHDVTILCVDRRLRLKKRKIGITSQTIDNIPCYSLFLMPLALISCISKALANRARESMGKMVYNYAVKQKGLPDIIYAHYLTNMALVSRLCKENSIPLVGIEHWSELNANPIKPYVRSLALNTYPYCSRIIAVSDSLRNSIKSNFGFDAISINNLVSADFLQSSDVSPMPESSTIEFVSVGALLPRKGHDILIKAFSKIKSKKEWHLNIIGSGPEKANLQQLIDSLHLHDNITLAGSKNKAEVHEYLAKGDAFVLASNCETFGVVFIEATATGLPVIGTVCGGPEEIINDSNGILVEKGNVGQLAEAIDRMIDTYHDYDKEIIARECREKYSPDVIGRKIEKVLLEAINEK